MTLGPSWRKLEAVGCWFGEDNLRALDKARPETTFQPTLAEKAVWNAISFVFPATLSLLKSANTSLARKTRSPLVKQTWQLGNAVFPPFKKEVKLIAILPTKSREFYPLRPTSLEFFRDLYRNRLLGIQGGRRPSSQLPWRIGPSSKGLIIMVSKSPNWVLPLPIWPFHGL